MQEYQQVLYKLHQPVTLKKGNISFETTIMGVSDTGRLMTKDTMEREFEFGEVEMIMR
jgi:BirA family biotin operon repressor/biotin-[acetyl-CoA-carboxylase] ligase